MDAWDEGRGDPREHSEDRDEQEWSEEQNAVLAQADPPAAQPGEVSSQALPSVREAGHQEACQNRAREHRQEHPRQGM